MWSVVSFKTVFHKQCQIFRLLSVFFKSCQWSKRSLLENVAAQPSHSITCPKHDCFTHTSGLAPCPHIKLYPCFTQHYNIKDTIFRSCHIFNMQCSLTVGGMNRRGFKTTSQSTVTKTTKKLRTSQTSETPMVYVPPVVNWRLRHIWPASEWFKNQLT